MQACLRSSVQRGIVAPRAQAALQQLAPRAYGHSCGVAGAGTGVGAGIKAPDGVGASIGAGGGAGVGAAIAVKQSAPVQPAC
jgi:hypothetical protein